MDAPQTLPPPFQPSAAKKFVGKIFAHFYLPHLVITWYKEEEKMAEITNFGLWVKFAGSKPTRRHVSRHLTHHENKAKKKKKKIGNQFANLQTTTTTHKNGSPLIWKAFYNTTKVTFLWDIINKTPWWQNLHTSVNDAKSCKFHCNNQSLWVFSQSSSYRIFIENHHTKLNVRT